MTLESPSDTFNIKNLYFDFWLLVPVISLCLIGFTMVTSASMDFANSNLGNPYYHMQRHGIYLFLGLFSFVLFYLLPINFIEKFSWLALIASFALLILVLIPGIGMRVNGSIRWINLGFFTLQPSETMKVAMVLYLSSYLVRRQDEVRSRWSGFFKPMTILAFVVVLLLLEPDFGAFVVILSAVLGMMFLAGVKAGQFFLVMAGCAIAVAIMAVSQEYRMLRLLSYLEPWSPENVYGSGYQLTQALIAFGRGEWFGVGLGNSIQKLFYLPEAHTDFVLSIFAEEFGLFGVVCLFTLFSVVVGRIMFIGKQAEQLELYFQAYCAYGVGIVLAIQAIINIGVNTGVLPTKGLTLPFVSYGGTSILICLGVIGLVSNIYQSVKIAESTQEVI
ncbi:putative lipid II flippase FtsW [Marinicellulosiphila megalodicopiae]|uniref:putative lipid II flippase FtsW n=1 Tax=Marinicellulosiphila megalodicopiae TaxID=2724896 RepID=UPI003BAE2B20